MPDSNILIYAKMTGMREHKTAFAWLSATLNDPNSTVVVCETVLLSFLRICTNSKAFDPPLPLDDAIKFVRSLLTRPDVQILRTSAQHFIDVAEFMKKHKFAGNLAMDAHLAVLAISTGAVLVTCDKDFKKVPYLKVLDPGTA